MMRNHQQKFDIPGSFHSIAKYIVDPNTSRNIFMSTFGLFTVACQSIDQMANYFNSKGDRLQGTYGMP